MRILICRQYLDIFYQYGNEKFNREMNFLTGKP